MAPYHLLALALLPRAAAAECACDLPTPCKGSGGCVMPRMENSSQCPEDSEDCRLAAPRTLCELGASARDGWCCWTACSSLAQRRTCGEAPDGFLFDKGERDGQYCHDPLNVQERCCLREMRTMRAAEPGSRGCPRSGSELVSIFERLDGSRASAPNQLISGAEVMKNREWLQEKGYLFLAANFSAVDADGDRGISWYELELFCGLVVPRLETDFSNLGYSDVKMILAHPILLAGLWSGIFIEQACALLMLVLNHAFGGVVGQCRRALSGREEENEGDGCVLRAVKKCRKAVRKRLEEKEDEEEGCVLKGAYFTFALAWPVAIYLTQFFYALFVIDWSVCDAPEGAGDTGDRASSAKNVYLIVSLMNFATMIIKVVGWIRRRCPFSPSLDIDRMILAAQWNRKHKCCLWLLQQISAVSVSALGITSVVFYGGTPGNLDSPELEKCSQEEPDLALLYKVNSSFLVGRCVQLFVVSAYVSLACPREDTSGNPKLKESKQDLEREPLKDHTEAERSQIEWQWFA